MKDFNFISSDYSQWLSDLKQRIANTQLQAARAVNLELIRLYWQIGHEILERQKMQGWGAKVITRLAEDLRTAFPEMKGFSRANLMYMRGFAAAWTEAEIVQEPLGQLPWYHQVTLLDKLSKKSERLVYADLAVKNGWSRNAMVHHIELDTAKRIGQAANNFSMTLPAPQSDLAIECLKDPYKLDFLGLGQEAQERDIENALVQHVTNFLLELGDGFAFVGKQVHLEVGEQDFYVDLLFYHIKLHCYIVIELKTAAFKPEHIGQLSFYVTAVDRQLKSEQDAPTIGLLLCKTKDKVVAEYALQDIHKPIGISEYELTRSIPENLKSSLPSIEQLETELAK